MSRQTDRAPDPHRVRFAAALAAAVLLIGWIMFSRPSVHRTLDDLSRRPPAQWGGYLVDKISHARQDLVLVRLSLLLSLGAFSVWGLVNARRVRGVIRRYFDEVGSPIDLAVFRIVLFAAVFLAANPAKIELYSRLPPELLTPPVLYGPVLRVLPITPGLASSATIVLRVACVFALIGFFTRPSALLSALVAIYVLGIPQCYGKVNHNHYLVWFALVLAFSRCGDALSVDAAWRRYRRGEPMPPPSPIYARPIRWVWLMMGVLYLFPGLWKLWVSGNDWLFGDALISHLRARWLLVRWVPVIRLDHYRGLARAAGIGAIAFELSFLPLVIPRATRPFAAIAGLAFHNLTNALMRIGFLGLQASYITFLPVRRLVLRLARRSQALPQHNPDAPESRTRTLDLVGGLLLSANALMGMLLIERAWPIACFPTFAWTHAGFATDLELVAISDAEKATLVDPWPLIRDLGPERWLPLTARACESPASLSAFVRWIASRSPEARGATRIVVCRVTRSTDPDRGFEKPVRRDYLAMIPL